MFRCKLQVLIWKLLPWKLCHWYFYSKFSIREQKELELIDSGDSQQNFWTAANPWIKDKTNLPNNRFFAEKCYLGQKKAFEN